MANDPFHHHPELRSLIKPAETSFFREFLPSQMDGMMAERGVGPDWRRSDAGRERTRHDALAQRPAGDLWVFAYGSLMWDPALTFEEVRRARLPGHCREMCLRDTLGGRGTREVPGLMAALVTRGDDDACEGLAFRVAENRIAQETEILWRREMLAPAYRPVFVRAEIQDGVIEALTFVADPSTELIALDLPREAQIRMLATGKGFLGSSLEYIENLLTHFDALGICDAHLADLRDGARALAAAG